MFRKGPRWAPWQGQSLLGQRASALPVGLLWQLEKPAPSNSGPTRQSGDAGPSWRGHESYEDSCALSIRPSPAL